MNRLKLLTVSQSMAVIFFSGFAVAVLFALSLMSAELRKYRSLSQDRALLVAARNMSTAIDVVQRERGLTTAWLAAPTAQISEALQEHRVATDAVLSRLQAETSDMAGRPGDLTIASIAPWLSDMRQTADARMTTANVFRDEMTAKIDDMIGTIVHSAQQARSARLALLIRDSTDLLWAKDALGLQRAIGAKISTHLDSGRSAPAADIADLRNQARATDEALGRFRLTANAEILSAIELWHRAPATHAFERIRDRIIAGDGITLPPDFSAAVWLSLSDASIEGLHRLALFENERHYPILRAEMAELRGHIIGNVALLVGLFLIFGSLAFATLKSVDKAVRDLIGTICNLSIDPPSTRVPPCPQKDLNQISNALRILRAALIESRRNQEAAELIRSSVDERLANVLTAAENGAPDQRLDVLGLDAHGALLARGINRLLDQIERERTASA